MADFVVVLTTLPEQFDAVTLARDLVDARLAACVNVLPAMTSVYQWEGRVDEAREQQVVIKTTAARVEALRDALAGRHPYEVPEFLVLPVADGGRTYLDWIRSSVGP